MAENIKGRHQFLVDRPADNGGPFWKGKPGKNAHILARGFFLITPDSGPRGEDVPLFLEFNPLLSSIKTHHIADPLEKFGTLVKQSDQYRPVEFSDFLLTIWIKELI